MSKLEASPERFVAEFFTSLTDAIIEPDADPAAVVDRYYTPDVVQVSDGIEIDRDKLIAHLRPIRKNLTGYRYEVHEAIAGGGRIAARFTIHARMRKGAELSTEVAMFGEWTPEGRLRRANQVTHTS